jgi:RNA polymerase sigma factor (sigma-70 family)
MAQLTDGLSESELEAARLGFHNYLWRKGFSPRFIETYGEDLLGRARFEYARAISRGAEIRSPAGWLVMCAYRRAQNQLTAEGAIPDLVKIEAAAAIPDEADVPEESVLEQDRAERLQDAVDHLPLEERMVVELFYFEGLSLREIARQLDWESTKAKRRHRSALEHLYEFLGVDSIDELEILVGLAAWVSLARERSAGLHLPAGLEAAADRGAHGIAAAWSRVQEFARRVLIGGGGEPASAAAASSAARTAGVCGAAAIACLATGVVGPGIGGIDLGATHHSPAPFAKHRAPGATAPVAAAGFGLRSSSSAASFSRQSASKKRSAPTSSSEGMATSSRSATRQVEREFSPFAGGGSSPAPSSSVSSPTSSNTTSSSSGHASAAAEKQTYEEFGLR